MFLGCGRRLLPSHCADENTEAQRERGSVTPSVSDKSQMGVQVTNLPQQPFSGLFKCAEAGIVFLEPRNPPSVSSLEDWDGTFTECLLYVRQSLN